VKLLLIGPVLAALGAAVWVGHGVLGPGSRIPIWLGGAGDLATIEAQIAELEAEISALEQESELLKADPFTIESAIREDLRMARAGEVVVRLAPNSRTNPRFP